MIAYLAGRVDKDPSLDWYNTVLLLFDDYAVPLAIRLRESRIFGMEGDELVRNAVENRRAWSRLGREMVKEMMTHYDLATKHKRSSSKSKAAVHGEGSTTSLVPGDCPASNGASATFSFAGDDDSSKYRFTLDDDLNPRSTQKQRKRSSKKRRPPLS